MLLQPQPKSQFFFPSERIEGNNGEVIENNGAQMEWSGFEDLCLFAKERIEGNNSEVIENNGVQMDLRIL